MKARLDTCEAQRRERMRNVMMIYEAEVKAANDDLKVIVGSAGEFVCGENHFRIRGGENSFLPFQAEKETLKERMLQELREKKRKIMLQGSFCLTRTTFHSIVG
eukprot:1389330-Amorphochlora_amoeboformis.AAC.1